MITSTDESIQKHCKKFNQLGSDWSRIAPLCYTPLAFNVPGGPVEGFPWDDLRIIMHGGQRMARVQVGVETLPKNFQPAEYGVWMLQTDDKRQTGLQ